MLNAAFSEDEVQFLVQGLDLLLASKRQAYSQACDGAYHQVFTPHDFGIPQIGKLLDKIEGSREQEEQASKVSS
jgi:hypothetical protein